MAELAKEWRTDRYLRKLEALLIVASKKGCCISGTGEVIEPDDGIYIGSGGGSGRSQALVRNTRLIRRNSS